MWELDVTLPNLGVTKDIMSQGLQVEDMECREPDDQLSAH
jgi:hypothetical protein